MPFSHALQHSPANFPPLYVATVRASERTGDLPEALSRYVAYQSQMDAVQTAGGQRLDLSAAAGRASAAW